MKLESAAALDLNIPAGHTSLLIVQQGDVNVNDSAVKAVGLVAFSEEGDQVRLAASVPSRLLILTGEPLREPVVGQGPFVMNTREQIREAIQDYQSGRMGHLS
jgi:redox-sensitive bicupin YhaK (pirin superfamily)